MTDLVLQKVFNVFCGQVCATAACLRPKYVSLISVFANIEEVSFQFHLFQGVYGEPL